MKGTKRPKRRARRRAKREYWNYLDRLAQAKIDRSYIASAESWGGTRCPGCGISVRPSWIVPYHANLGGIIISGQTLACQGIGKSQVKCPGERDWW